MKKLLPLIALILFINQAITAQESEAQVIKKFGILVGGNLSTMNFNKGFPTPTTSVNTSWMVGGTVGIVLRVPLSEKFRIQPQYQFTQMGSKVENTDTKYKLSYFSMPVLLVYQLLPKLEIEAGPQFDLLLHGASVVNGVSTNVTHGLQEPNYAFTAGLGYWIIKDLNLGVRYMQSLNHIGFGKLADTAEFKFQMVQVTVSRSF